MSSELNDYFFQKKQKLFDAISNVKLSNIKFPDLKGISFWDFIFKTKGGYVLFLFFFGSIFNLIFYITVANDVSYFAMELGSLTIAIILSYRKRNIYWFKLNKD